MGDNSSKFLEATEFVWRPNSTIPAYSCWSKHRDFMFSVHIALVGLFTNHIVPFPDNEPYEYYTLSNDVVFTATLSKALRKTFIELEMPSNSIQATVVTNASSGNQVLCYNNTWGACPDHMAHCHAPDFVVNWRTDERSWKECLRFVSDAAMFGDLAVLRAFFPELFSKAKDVSNEEKLPNMPALSIVAILQGECLRGASKGGEKVLVKRLLAAGADVDAVFVGGRSSWYFPSRLGPNADVVVSVLPQASSLLVAAYYGHVEVVKILLDAGADAKIQNEWGMVPLDFAQAKKSHATKSIIDLLLAASSKS